MSYITGWIVVGIITLGIYKLFELFVLQRRGLPGQDRGGRVQWHARGVLQRVRDAVSRQGRLRHDRPGGRQHGDDHQGQGPGRRTAQPVLDAGLQEIGRAHV